MSNEKSRVIGNKILNVVTEFFVACIIILFPLLVNETGFFRILEHKWYSHLTIVSTYIFAVLATYIYFLIVKRVNLLKGRKISKPQIFMIAFLGINIISTLFSPYLKTHDLLIGSGRGEGIINIFLYSISFIFVSTFLKFEKRQIKYFSLSALIFSIICVIQYFGGNPFNMYRDGIGTHNVSFLGTIGNVDFISAYYTIVLVIAFVCYLFEEDKFIWNLLHLTAFNIGMFIFQVIDVDSGKVALVSIIALLAPYILLSGERLSRTLITISGVVIGFMMDLILNLKYDYDLAKLSVNFQLNEMVIGMFISAVALIVLALILRKKDYYWLHKRIYVYLIYAVMIVGVLFAIGMIYIEDFDVKILHELHEILHGNFKDEYGTYRVFLWKRAASLIPDAPILGTGSDTFAIRFMDKYTGDIKSLGELTINDTAANVYLTILVNTGWLGFAAFVLLLLSVLYKLMKVALKGELHDKLIHGNKYYYILAIAVLAYAIQDIFNLWVVIVTPIYFVTMAMADNVKRERHVEKIKIGNID